MIRAIWHKELITEKDAGSGAHPASFVVRHCAVACSHHQERCRLLMRIPELHVRKCAVKRCSFSVRSLTIFVLLEQRAPIKKHSNLLRPRPVWIVIVSLLLGKLSLLVSV